MANVLSGCGDCSLGVGTCASNLNVDMCFFVCLTLLMLLHVHLNRRASSAYSLNKTP